jgi:hypothetical protein
MIDFLDCSVGVAGVSNGRNAQRIDHFHNIEHLRVLEDEGKTDTRSLGSVGPSILKPFTSLNRDNACRMSPCSRAQSAFLPND